MHESSGRGIDGGAATRTSFDRSGLLLAIRVTRALTFALALAFLPFPPIALLVVLLPASVLLRAFALATRLALLARLALTAWLTLLAWLPGLALSAWLSLLLVTLVSLFFSHDFTPMRWFDIDVTILQGLCHGF